MAIYEITKFSGGLSDFDDRGIVGSFKFGSGLDIRKDVDSLSCQQALVDEGLLASNSPSLSQSPSASASRSPSPSSSASVSPTPSPSASASPSASPSRSPSTTPSSSISPSPSPSAGLTTVFHDLIRFFVKCDDGYTYGFGSTGYIYRRDADAYWQRVYKDPNGAIKGAAEWYSDTGKAYLYWATDKQLNRKEIPGLSNWNDVNTTGVGTWPKTNLESATWHTMTEAGGSLIIANRQYLALVGYDDSYTNEALNLIPGRLANVVIERNGRSIVGTARAGNPNRGVNGMIDSELPLSQIGDDGEIFYSDMNNSIALKSFPGGGKVNPGGVTNEVDQVDFFEWEQNALSWIDKQSVGNMALFGVYNATTGRNGIYSYGRKKKNAPFVLNLDYPMDVDEIGAVVNVDGTTLASYRDGSDFGVMAVDPTAKGTGIYEGLDFRAPVKKPEVITGWTMAEVLCDPLPNGASIEFWYKINKTGDWIRAYTASGGLSFNSAQGKKAVFRIGAEGDIFEPRVVLYPTGNDSPEIHRIRVYFQ